MASRWDTNSSVRYVDLVIPSANAYTEGNKPPILQKPKYQITHNATVLEKDASDQTGTGSTAKSFSFRLCQDTAPCGAERINSLQWSYVWSQDYTRGSWRETLILIGCDESGKPQMSINAPLAVPTDTKTMVRSNP